MLGDVSKSLLTTPSNVLLLHFNQTFSPIIWIFTEVEDDGIEFRLGFKIFSSLLAYDILSESQCIKYSDFIYYYFNQSKHRHIGNLIWKALLLLVERLLEGRKFCRSDQLTIRLFRAKLNCLVLSGLFYESTLVRKEEVFGLRQRRHSDLTGR